MAVKIYVEGTSLIINDIPNALVIEKDLLKVVIFNDKTTRDQYRFYEIINGINEEYYQGGLTADAFQEKDGTPYTAATFEAFYRFVKKNFSLEADVTDGPITVNKTTATTLLVRNDSRLGVAFSNRGTQDAYIRLKAAATDNLQQGIFLAVDDTIVINDMAYVDEISGIRSGNTGNQTSEIQVNEW